MGDAKKLSLAGDSLDMTQEQVIPANQFYVAGTSADSFDSRYSNFGLIDANNIIGVAYPLW
jgi:conjugal transfer pilin signal peptidase TrbI